MDFSNPEYRAIILGAFLHDIGKLLGRSDSKLLEKAKHPKFSADFISAHNQVFQQYVDAALLKELVQRHHEDTRFPPELQVQTITDPRVRSLAKLVSLSDNLSSSERGESAREYRDFTRTPLCSVIERLNCNTDDNVKLCFRPMPLPSTLSPEMEKSIFPEEFTEYKAGELTRQIEGFGKEFERYIKSVNSSVNYEAFLNHINNLVYKYTWCIPSNTQEDYPDVSLYDHLKISAAIAACLYQYHVAKDTLNEKSIAGKTAERFLLVGGDISGIQSYIFDITSAGGIARKLRARSLIVQSCSDIAAHRILNAFNLPLWNNIMSSGGNFYLLVPDLPGSAEMLSEIQADMDRWFLREMNGELAINFAWHKFGNDGFRPVETGDGEAKSGFSHIIYELKNKLSKKKQNRFVDVLVTDRGWEEANFVSGVEFAGKGICKSCYKLPASVKLDNNIEICHDCNEQTIMGARLPGAVYFAYHSNLNPGMYPLMGYGLSVADKPSFTGKPYLITKLNDTDLTGMPGLPASFKYMASYVPKAAGGVKTFEEMARQAEGQPLLGFLKADVDNLGESFIFGFKRDKKSIDTISRQATLSRLLDTFFSGWVEHLVSTKYKDCYTVFSGGDDLFYVGPWRQVLELATQIKADFACFTNGKFTLSAGVFIARHDYPIARAAEEVNEALKKSKQGDSSGAKDRITILGDTMTWGEWEKIKSEWVQILPFATDKQRMSSSFLYNLLDYAVMWRNYLAGDTGGLRYHPMLAYNITRNLNSRNDPELYQWASSLLKWPPDAAHGLTLKHLGLITKLTLFNRRGGKDDRTI